MIAKGLKTRQRFNHQIYNGTTHLPQSYRQVKVAYKLLSCEAENQKIKHTRGAKNLVRPTH